MKIHGEHVKLHADWKPKSELNQGYWSSEAAMIHTASPCHACIYTCILIYGALSHSLNITHHLVKSMWTSYQSHPYVLLEHPIRD